MDNGNKKKIGIIAAILFVLVVVVIGVLTLINRQSTEEVTDVTATEIRVAITDEGFSPSAVTVNKGATVVWVNDTATPRKIGATPFPDASTLPGLKSDDIPPGESYSYTFNDIGSFNYADYTIPTSAGAVQVK